MNNEISYEQPLNERVRTFLRLEFLFNIVRERQNCESELDSRETINATLDIVDLLSRSDLKSELIKELEKHAATLSALRDNPNVDQHRLHGILGDLNHQLQHLHDPAYQPGSMMKKNDLITSVKQRSSMPGGSCNFDLPGYHYWLNQPHSKRLELLELVYTDLKVIGDSVELSLHMLRNSANPSNEIAEAGFFQKPIESELPCQLIRVILDHKLEMFPEISGGKHRFTIRFMQQDDTLERPIQSRENIPFQLHCCML